VTTHILIQLVLHNLVEHLERVRSGIHGRQSNGEVSLGGWRKQTEMDKAALSKNGQWNDNFGAIVKSAKLLKHTLSSH